MRSNLTRFLLVATWALPCLVSVGGAAEEVSTPSALKKVPSNTWVKLGDFGTSADFMWAKPPHFGLVYGRRSRRFVLFGGTAGQGKGIHSCPDMTFDLRTCRWKGLSPSKPGRVPAAGEAYVPLLRGEGYANSYQYAWDDSAGRLYVYDWKEHTSSYDPETRVWKDLKPGKCPGRALWGAMCYLPVRKDVLLANAGGSSEPNGSPGTWIYNPARNEWRRLAFGSGLINGLRTGLEGLRRRAADLVAAARNRQCLSETTEEARIDLSAQLAAIVADAAKASDGLKAAKGGDEYETRQLRRARAVVTRALAAAGALGAGLKGRMDGRSIAALREFRDALRHASDELAVEPPPRCMSPLCYDEEHRKVIVFGGDGHARFYADTWVFDPKGERWTEMHPAVGPSPRAGHALLWLPKGRKALLVGRGYRPPQELHKGENWRMWLRYEELPLEMWAYDLDSDRWALVKSFDGQEPAPPALMGKCDTSLFAVDGSDVVLGKGTAGSVRKMKATTWACRVDVSAVDKAGTSRLGVKPRSEIYHAGPHDPGWYDRARGADTAGVEAKLKAMPANTWVALEPEVLPENRNYGTFGSCILDPLRDQLLWWAGGHSSYCGNEVVHYAVKTNRWSLSYRPAHPLAWESSNGGGPGGHDFEHRPWQSMHPYRWYAWDPKCRRMVYNQNSRHGLTYTYDPARRDWDERCYPASGGNIVTTPHGAFGVSRWDGSARRFEMGKGWVALPQKGGKLKAFYSDYTGAGLAYDTKRDRVYVIPSRSKGQILIYDWKTGRVSEVQPKGAGKVAEKRYWREAVYIPEADIVLFAAGKASSNYVYDPAANEWKSVSFKPEGILDSGTGNGLIYHPGRKMLFLMKIHGKPYALRLDPKTLRIDPLK